MKSVELTKENIAGFDLIILATDHQDYDYKFISENEKLILDTRNAFGNQKSDSYKIYSAQMRRYFY